MKERKIKYISSLILVAILFTLNNWFAFSDKTQDIIIKNTKDAAFSAGLFIIRVPLIIACLGTLKLIILSTAFILKNNKHLPEIKDVLSMLFSVPSEQFQMELFAIFITEVAIPCIFYSALYAMLFSSFI